MARGPLSGRGKLEVPNFLGRGFDALSILFAQVAATFDAMKMASLLPYLTSESPWRLARSGCVAVVVVLRRPCKQQTKSAAAADQMPRSSSPPARSLNAAAAVALDRQNRSPPAASACARIGRKGGGASVRPFIVRKRARARPEGESAIRLRYNTVKCTQDGRRFVGNLHSDPGRQE